MVGHGVRTLYHQVLTITGAALAVPIITPILVQLLYPMLSEHFNAVRMALMSNHDPWSKV